MTKTFIIAMAAWLSFQLVSVAQETATITPTVTPSVTPAVTLITSATPAGSPSATAVRNVRISFLPPPLEGTISLGIYNEWDQLVRVLHQEAELDEFTIGDDALSTKWDGKDDDGQDLPAGKYQARGFTVGNLKTESGPSPSAGPADPGSSRSVPVKLMPNPLANDARTIIELSVGFDDENSFLKTADGLPIYTLARKRNVLRASIARAGEKSVDVWEDDGSVVEQLHVSNVDRMMAFDGGDFELR